MTSSLFIRVPVKTVRLEIYKHDLSHLTGSSRWLTYCLNIFDGEACRPVATKGTIDQRGSGRVVLGCYIVMILWSRMDGKVRCAVNVVDVASMNNEWQMSRDRFRVEC